MMTNTITRPVCGYYYYPLFGLDAFVPKLPKPTRDLSGFSYFGICEKSRKSFGP